MKTTWTQVRQTILQSVIAEGPGRVQKRITALENQLVSNNLMLDRYTSFAMDDFERCEARKIRKLNTTLQAEIKQLQAAL